MYKEEAATSSADLVDSAHNSLLGGLPFGQLATRADTSSRLSHGDAHSISTNNRHGS